MELLTINTLIQWVDTKKTERILWINNKDGIVFTIDIYANTYKPDCKHVLDIMDDLHSKKAVLLTDTLCLTIAKDEDLKTHEKEKRDKAWEVLSYIFDKCHEPHIFESAKKSTYIKEASHIFSISERSIYEYLRRYWQGGKQINALLPNYKNCGGAGKDKSAGTKKRGRPGKYIGHVGVNVDDRTKDIFRLSIKKFYFTSHQNSLKTAYELMIKEYYADTIRFEDGVKKSSIMEGNKLPSLSQFRYWYKKERDIQKEVTLRKSAKRYLLENRAVLGSSTQEAIGPGSIYQIDATVADVYLVSRYNRNNVIGRPVVYTVVDVFSHMVVGMYVGLEGPSWIGSMAALLCACMDKVDFCKEYGITITHEDFPAHHIPDAIVADRGELEGKSVEGIISGLNIKILNTASYRADMKGIVESHFKSINVKVKPFLPGFINEDYRQRGGRDYKLDAKLDLYQFTQIILKTILHHNRSWLNNYKREEMAISDDIDPVPIKLWNWGIENRAGKLRTMPEDIVKLNLMPRDTAIVTGSGIKFKGIYYGSEKALREKWFEKARNIGSWKVDIAYDARDMNFIYIIGSDFKSFEKCFLLKREERYFNKTLYEIEYLLESEAIQQRQNHEQELQSKVDLYSEIEAIVKEAETSNGKELSDISSNASKVKSIRGNRHNEKMMNREQEAFELKKSNSDKEGRVIRLNSDETDFDLPTDTALLRKKQKERFNGHN